MKKLLRYCGLVALAGAALYLPSCDDDGPGPVPYTGPWKVVTYPGGPPYLSGVFFLSANLGYAVGCEYILKYDGAAWKVDFEYPEEEGKISAGFYDVWFNTPADGWVVGSWYDIENNIQKGIVMHYDGKVWEKVEHNTPSVWYEDVFFLDENNGWVGGYGIARWDGNEWHYETDVGFITDMYFNSAADGWAVTMHGECIYHYDGSSWTLVHDDPWGIELYSVWFTSPDRGWAGGSHTISEAQSCLMEYKNGKWGYYQLPDRRSGVHTIHFSSPKCGWAGEQYTYYYDGDKWSRVKDPVTNFINDVFTISENDAWAVGEGRTILHYEP